MPGQSCARLGTRARCAHHTRAWQALRNADRPIARAVVASSPRCVDCGTRGDAGNPLTADHVVPLIRSGSNLGERATRCRDCNRAKGVT